MREHIHDGDQKMCF